MSRSKFLLINLILFLVLIGVFLIALGFGAADISFKDIKALFLQEYSSTNTLLLYEIRLPRILASALVGAALGVAGAFMQGMTRNPIASPSLFGLVAGSTAALAIAIVVFQDLNYLGVLAACLIGSLVAGFVVFMISSSKKQSLNPVKVVLAGVAISMLLNAIADFFVIKNAIAKQISMWSGSGLVGITYTEILIILPIIALFLILSIFYADKLTLISMDDEVATSLGEDVRKLRIIFFFIVTFLTGASIALAGSISFVGLIIPHLVRKIVGGDYKYIIPISVLCGMILLIFADLLSRTINAPFETPITAIFAIASYPIFLYIVKTRKGF